MKKVSLLILLVIVLSTVLMAAVPTKMMRLTIINKSDYDVYMQLEGSAVTEAFYYLTIPTGSRDEPTVKIFTIMSDIYSRTTWACDGLRSRGTLAMSNNIRLTFVPCGQFQWKYSEWLSHYYGVDTYVRNMGEPTMEKVARWRYLSYGMPSWDAVSLYNGYWNWGCFTFFWRSRSYTSPIGCEYRYQY